MVELLLVVLGVEPAAILAELVAMVVGGAVACSGDCDGLWLLLLLLLLVPPAIFPSGFYSSAHHTTIGTPNSCQILDNSGFSLRD